MNHMVSLSDEELSELDQILIRESSRTHVELRRTSNRNFREHVRHHLDVVEEIRKRIETAQASSVAQA